MLLHERIKQIREYRGMKQLSVAHEMGITQQAYSWMETKSANIKMETLERFCAVMKIDITFLMAENIAITAENMEIFQHLNYAVIFEDYKRLRNRIQKYEDLSLRKAS
jgi:transcriptional regulator with XRE-family HTH domain